MHPHGRHGIGAVGSGATTGTAICHDARRSGHKRSEAYVSHENGVDFAIAAYRDEREWRVAAVSAERLDGLATVTDVVAALRQLALEASEVLGLVSVGDDFFLLLRATDGTTRMMISDASAAEDWALADSALALLGIEPEEADEDPAGDLAVFADLGLDPMELAALCADEELYPEDVLRSVASRLGMGDQFDRELAST
jgi:putative tRNA adenosine deaminase-associated protein